MDDAEQQPLSRTLRKMLARDVCVVGVGNRMRGDDAVGPVVIDALRPRVSYPCIDVGVAPENHLEKIAATRPHTVLLIDAVDFQGEPGELRLFRPGDSSGGLSTHALSLDLAAQYLAKRCGAETWLVGLQPEQIVMEAALSPAVREAVERLVGMLAG